MRKIVHVGISIIQFFWLKIVVNIQIQFYIMSCPSSSILFKKWQFYMIIIIIFIIATDFAQGIGLEVGGTPSNEPWKCQILPCWWSHIGPTRSWITVKTSNSGRKIPLREGRIALASGGMLLGEVTITDSFLLARNGQDGLEDIPPDSFSGLTHRHQVEDAITISNYKKVWAWELKDPIQYCPPRPFDHPRGAICWINLTKIKQQQPKSKTGKQD